ncbi:MAG TPA: V-type ATPase subunit [Trueperaceae bacterium]
MSSDFGYINARIRGMKAKLLEPEFYTQALADTDFRAFTGTVAQTSYVADLEEAQARTSGLEALDWAVAQNFRRTARSILDFSDGRPGELLTLFLLSYDLMNLKTLARAKHAGRDAESALDVALPAGEMRPALIETLAAAPDLPSMAQALAVTGHPLSRAFSAAVRRYAQEGELYTLELTLDRFCYKSLLDALDEYDAPRELRRHVKREIDATNLRTALKLRGRTVAREELYVPGGAEIDRGTFDAIIADTSKSALSALAGSAFAEVAETDSLSEADAVIRGILDESAHRVALSDPLGPGVALDFLRKKEAEAAKLRLLARGKFYDVPREQLERELGNA